MSLVSNCIATVTGKRTEVFADLENDIDTHFDRQQTTPTKSLRAYQKQSVMSLGKKDMSKVKLKTISGYSPERQRSLVLQIKIVERKKKQLLDQLKLVDKNLTMLVDQKDKYDEIAKSKKKLNPETDSQMKIQYAMEFVRKMNRQRKQMDNRRHKTQERINREIQKSERHAEQMRRMDELKQLEKRKQVLQKIQKRRSSVIRYLQTPKRQSNSFLTQIGEPIQTDTLPKVQTKKYPKTKFYKLIKQESRLKKISQELKQKNKLYNLQRRKLYNFVNQDKNKQTVFHEKSFVSYIRQC